MKKILLILLTITLFLPLYAQEAEPAPDEGALKNWNEGEFYTEDEESELVDGFEDGLQPKSKVSSGMLRQHFEVGTDIRVGFDNGLIGTGDFFKKKVVIDLNKMSGSIRDGGLNINADGNGSILYLDILNIKIKEGLWDFGFFVNADGRINFNVPKSLFTLITQGNIYQHSFEGMLSASGGIYANTGLNASAKYGKLRVGLKPTLFTPLIFIPKSGITYHLETEDAVDLTASGEIIVYYPLNENGSFTGLNFGFDMSLDGEYALFPPLLDIGGALSRIPLVPATLQNRMKMSMSGMDYYRLTEDMIMEGEFGKTPDPKFDDPVYDTEPRKVLRPFRFDVYARYKPFRTEILVIRPNMGFSIDGNELKGYFNAGLEIRSTLARNIVKLYLATGYEEAIWKHRLGFAFNVRVFEQFAEFTFQSENFAGSLSGYGYGLNLGTRFGW